MYTQNGYSCIQVIASIFRFGKSYLLHTKRNNIYLDLPNAPAYSSLTLTIINWKAFLQVLLADL